MTRHLSELVELHDERPTVPSPPPSEEELLREYARARAERVAQYAELLRAPLALEESV